MQTVSTSEVFNSYVSSSVHLAKYSVVLKSNSYIWTTGKERKISPCIAFYHYSLACMQISWVLIFFKVVPVKVAVADVIQHAVIGRCQVLYINL